MDRAFCFAQPEWLGEIDSTSNYLKAKVAAGGVRSGRVVAAHRQTAARGRLGNRWRPAPGGDLTFSFYWNGVVEPLAAGALPMACALGVRDFLALPPWRVHALCKWPNDVMVNDAKICGILTEGGIGPGGTMGLVVGIGVNVRPFPDRDKELGKKTASLEELAGNVGAAPELLPALLDCLETRIAEWESGGTRAVLESMRGCLWGVGKQVRARTVKGNARGVVEGLGDEGELLLRDGGGITGVSSVNALESGWE